MKPDPESFLSYAPREEALAAVLYINEPLSPEGWRKSNELAQQLTRLAVLMDGFFQAKHRYDPENRFTSRFFELYWREFLARRAAAGS